MLYDIKATCEKIEIGAQHVLRDKKIPFFQQPYRSDLRSQLQLFQIYYKRTYSFAFFSLFFTVRNYIMNAAGDVGVAHIHEKNSAYQ